MKHALILSLGLAFVATAALATPHDAVGDAVAHRTPKTWFTPAQTAYIRDKCGVDAADHKGNLNIQGSVMTCPDGRTVNDPQVKAMGDDVSRRANAFARDIMKQADVQRAIATATSENVRKALAVANIDQQVRDALAQAEIGRKTAERVREELAKSGLGDTH